MIKLNTKDSSTSNKYEFKLKHNLSEITTSGIDGKLFMNNIKLPIIEKLYFLS